MTENYEIDLGNLMTFDPHHQFVSPPSSRPSYKMNGCRFFSREDNNNSIPDLNGNHVDAEATNWSANQCNPFSIKSRGVTNARIRGHWDIKSKKVTGKSTKRKKQSS